MNPSPSNLLVAVANEVGFVKVIGRANVALSVHFKILLAKLQGNGFRNFVLDLGECATMDSTFLGVLVGAVLHSAGTPPEGSATCLQLLNPNQRVAELLENLGVAHLFAMLRGANPAEAALEPSAPTHVPASKEEITRTCLEAHQLLMAVNPENVPKFKDVAQFLAEDLKKLKEEAGGSG
ncbi:MAG: STAS domain-containing protein [Verrucomicrobia bacterium]|nr:STAS domain-containing protein [Verrucomicrobiota bacterium]